MVFYTCSRQTVPTLRAELQKRGFANYVLDGHSIGDEGSFLQIFARDVPFEVFSPTDLVPPVNWDAFVDCLSSGLGSRSDDQVAIIWEGADRMLNGNLPLLVSAVECLSGEAHRLMRHERPILLVVCLVGDGPNFPQQPDTRSIFGTDASEIPCVEIRMARDNDDEA